LAEKTFPNRSVIIDKRLMELNFGDWELKSWDAIYSSIEGRTWMDNYQTNPTLGGESYLQMFERVSAFLEELKVKEISECVIFTHAGVVRILKSLIDDVLIGTLFETFKPAYGSITTFDLKY
jgi:alpha-ribazole phosphatase